MSNNLTTIFVAAAAVFGAYLLYNNPCLPLPHDPISALPWCYAGTESVNHVKAAREDICVEPVALPSNFHGYSLYDYDPNGGAAVLQHGVTLEGDAQLDGKQLSMPSLGFEINLSASVRGGVMSFTRGSGINLSKQACMYRAQVEFKRPLTLIMLSAFRHYRLFDETTPPFTSCGFHFNGSHVMNWGMLPVGAKLALVWNYSDNSHDYFFMSDMNAGVYPLGTYRHLRGAVVC